MKRNEANKLNDYYSALVGKTYDNKYIDGLIIVPTKEDKVKELAYNLKHNNPKESAEILSNYDDFNVLVVFDFDIQTSQFSSRNIADLAKEMEANNFKWENE